MSNEELTKLYSILQIENNIEEISYRDATAAFCKLAVKTHPDRAGPESTAAFHYEHKLGVRRGIAKSDLLNLIFFPMVFTHKVRMKAL